MKKADKITTQKIQQLIGTMQVLKFHSPVIENIQMFWRYEYDVMSVSKSGMVCEFEVKVSRTDFLRPKEKAKQRNYAPKPNMVDGKIFIEKVGNVVAPNYFSYCCPTNLIKAEELPDWAGLYYCDGIEITEIRAPKRIHKHTFELKHTYKKVMRFYSERQFLGGCRMTFENRKAVKRYNEHIKRQEEEREKNRKLNADAEKLNIAPEHLQKIRAWDDGGCSTGLGGDQYETNEEFYKQTSKP